MHWTTTRLKAAAYGAAAAAIGLDSLAAGETTPFLPFGSSVSLVAAGLILIFWPPLAPVAARLAALIFAVWAIVLKAPLIVAEPANGPAWLALAGLLALAAAGPRLGVAEAGAGEGEEKVRVPEWRPLQGASPIARRPGYQGSRG
ncbi:hypothetical protein [Sphingosinicella sp.]|uniref:hypothetical protein n=1 Tax=Sphingosinicella sp. TaxID=1917971 RepID=UPI004037DCA5